jgi:hypothetical protein
MIVNIELRLHEDSCWQPFEEGHARTLRAVGGHLRSRVDVHGGRADTDPCSHILAI